MLEIKREDVLELLLDDTKLLEAGLDPKKGFLLLGSAGVWKTSIMKEYIKIKGKGCHDINSDEIFSFYLQGGILNKYYLNHPMYIDDLGSEATRVQIYGTELLPVTTLMLGRYNSGYITSATSNVPLEELKLKYGGRVTDRFLEMFNILIITGISQRVINSNKK